ncbi:cold-shock protein [Alicyclobacillus mali (ex Roth et al. 2021)]|uniref:cold-shock protein n=1 Tax=Alicyclobacillus mali (ex Roth et al. 2021) TaxID=1123961 RepID=UPI00082A4D66|nr:cold shock domain-containing protein [Alicyclobacillus mali (ex Roth et al. 2021)]
MVEGSVKEWRDEEDFGWIRADDGEDVWVHFSAILPHPDRFPRGYRFLRKGQRVEFDLVTNPHSEEQRRSARNVVVKDSPCETPPPSRRTQDAVSPPPRPYPQRIVARVRLNGQGPGTPT